MIKMKTAATAAFLLLAVSPTYAATAALSTAGSFQIADAREVVRDETTGTVVRSSSGACVRTKWMTNDDVCSAAPVASPPPPAPVQQTVALSREERTVYFGFNLSSLSPEMKQRLDTLANALRSDKQVKGARIVGYADRIGNASYNEKLSQKRAQNVRQYLVDKGLINTQIADTRWLGASDPETSCPANLKKPKLIECLQKDRRVEVEIDYQPEAHASR